MTLPAAPPMTMAQMCAEFGIAVPCVFPRDFYGKGGAPTSGSLGFADFLGRSNITFNPTPGAYSADTKNAGGASVQVTASVAVVWSWTSLPAGVTASVAKGASSTSIVFTAAQHNTSTVLFTAALNGQTYNFEADFADSGAA